jgi:HEAT repeat protein
VRRTEQPRLAWLYAMLFVSIMGCVWGEAVIEAGFLRDVGIQYLPLAIIGNAVVSMATITIYNAFADRVANQKLLIAILIFSVVGMGISVLLLAYGQVMIAFPLLYVVDSVVFGDLLNVHWPIYVNGFFDTQSAKRVVPVLSSAARLAAIIGGLTMPVLTHALSPTAIIFVMLLMQLVMVILIVLMRRTLGDPSVATSSPPAPSDPRQAIAHIQEGYRYIIGSSFLRWIAAATLLMTVLLAFINYQSGYAMLVNLKTAENIANFTAMLSALANLLALPLQLFVLSRLIGRVGVGNAALIYPATSLTAIASLTLAPNFITAGFGYLTRTVVRTTFHSPADSLLYNAVPLRMKARARGFISGYVMTTGSLIGGGPIMLFNAQSAIPLLAVLFGGLALVYMFSAIQVRRQYGKAVVAMLEQDDYVSLLTSSDVQLAAVDDATLNRLAAKMAQSGDNLELKGFVAQVICQVGGVQAVPILAEAIRQAGNGQSRAKLLEILAASGSNPVSAEAIFTAYLGDPEQEVRQAALVGLERTAGENTARFRSLVTPLLTDHELGVRAVALSALVRNRGFYTQPAAGLVLDTLLASDRPDQRVLGARILGQLVHSLERPVGDAFVPRFLESLRDSSDEVRLAAALALEESIGRSEHLPEWLPLPVLGQLLSDPVERVRYAAAILLGQSFQSEAHEMLIKALSDVSATVRLASGQGLVQAGPAIINLIRPLLDTPRPRLRTVSAAILGRVDPVQFGSNILSVYVPGHLQAAYRTWGYLAALASSTPSPASNLLKSALSERNAQRIEEIFYLLCAIRSPQAVNKIAISLRSQDPNKRANALEALEVLTTPQIARLLGPLCEEPPDTNTILTLSSTTWDQLAPDSEQTVRALMLDPEDPWLGELAAMVGSPNIHPLENKMFSDIEKVIFLKEVPFFQAMTVEQLRVLASVCEEEFFPADTHLFVEGDPGGALYVVTSGRVGIEQEKRKGSFVRIATVEAHSYLGETDFFDNNRRTNSAIAIQDTLTLRLRREPLIALSRQYPDLSLELINVLSSRLREANDRIAELTRAHPQKLHKLYDQLN